MKKKVFAPIAANLISMIILLVMFNVLTKYSSGVAAPAFVAPLLVPPVVTLVDPVSAPNDLDTSIVITGTGFTAGLSGTIVITQPNAYLGNTALPNVTWVSTTTLFATVPWGMDPGVYTLTVVNPDGEAGNLPNAFTVEPGIGEWNTGGPYGGWVNSLVLGDSQGQTIYATVTNVGLFRSRDGGASWELIFIEIGHQPHPEIDPMNLERLYISKAASGNTGLYQSEDGGDTWTAMPQPIPGISTRMFRAYVRPQDSMLFGALRADLDDPSCDSGCGLFRFDETAQIWIRLEQSGLLDETTGVTAVDFDPVDPQIMYVGLVGGLVLMSTDGGQTWSSHSQTPLSYIKELVVNPVGREPWVCSTGGFLPGGLYKYDGVEWISMYSDPGPFTKVNAIIFDPSAVDPQTQHIWISANLGGVLISEDGGQSWSAIGSDGEAIALNPLDPQTIYSGSPDGVSKTSDGGASWQPINEGLSGIVPNHLGVNPLDPANVYASAVGIFGSHDGGEAWQKLNDGNGPIVVDPANPLHVVVGTNIADDGWHFNRKSVIPFPAGMDPNRYQVIINSMVARFGIWLLGVGYFDGQLPYYNYEGGAGIYLSPDGENWVLASHFETCPPTSFGFDPVDTNIFYAVTSGTFGGVNGTCKATFLKSTDSGQTWQESTNGLPAEPGSIMAINPEPPYQIFLSGSFISLDQGGTWSPANGPPEGVTSLLFLPGTPPILYAGTRAGFFRTMDETQTWQRAQGSLGWLEIWSMAGTTVSDRQIIYVSTVGGVVDNGAMQMRNLVQSNKTLVNGGVYRYTMGESLPVYLPLLLRPNQP